MGTQSDKSKAQPPPLKPRISSRFMSFLLLAWEPKVTWKSTITSFFLWGLVALAFGLFVADANASITEIVTRYDETCGLPTSPAGECVITFDITEKMTQPIFLQYGIDNFFQNHRAYIESYSHAQISGNDISLADAIKSCTPAVTNQDLGVEFSWDTKVPLEPTAVASPCGLKAKTYFNDEYELWKGTKQIPLDEKDIAYPKGGNKFKKSPTSSTTQWINPENEHFIVWMTPSSLFNFRKLWARVKHDLEPGTYQIKIKNKYDVTSFNGKKYFIITNSSVIGGKNHFLAYTYFIGGVIFLLIAMLFAANPDLG